MKGRRKIIEIKDFSGGLVTKSPPKNIDMKFSVDCMNVYNEGAILRERGGIALVATTTGVGNGLYNWIRGNATTNQWLVGFWGANLLQMSVSGGAWSGSWTAVVADSASGTSFTAGTMYFANYNGVLLMATENQDRVQKMTTTDASYKNVETGGTGTAPQCKYLNVWKNHAWYLNCVNSEDRVVHSGVNSYNNFTADTYGYNDLWTENDIGVTGSFILNGRLYATKGFSIHRFTYTGSPSPLVEIRTIKSNVGTKSPRTIKNVNTPDGEVVLFLGSNLKMYLCDGQDTKEVSDAIDTSNSVATVYMQAINANCLNRCWSVVHSSLNWYETFVCVGTATAPNYSIVYDYVMKSFWPMDNRNFTAGTDADNGSGQRKVYTQGSGNGKMYLTNSTNSDEGTAVNSFWTSQKIGSPVDLTKMDEIEIETESVVCAPTFSWRADWESTFISQAMKASTNTHNFSPNRVDNLLQVKIAKNAIAATFKLWTIMLSERIVGGGK